MVLQSLKRDTWEGAGQGGGHTLHANLEKVNMAGQINRFTNWTVPSGYIAKVNDHVSGEQNTTIVPHEANPQLVHKNARGTPPPFVF